MKRPETRRTDLEQYVLDFATRSGLGDRYEMLLFGARFARDKYEAKGRYRDELTAPEMRLLDHDTDKKAGFWQQSKFFRATIMTASLGGLLLICERQSIINLH